MAVLPPSVPLRVIVVGLGAIGRAVAEAVKHDPGLSLVGGVDLSDNARHAARSLFADAPVTAILDELPQARLAIACVGPRFDRLAPTIRQALARNIAVISDCAEMTWPWLRHPHLADVIANEARKANTVVCGGSDDLSGAALLLGATGRVDLGTPARVFVRRQTDLRVARPSVLRHLGVGRSPEQFRKLAAERLVGIAGQAERVVMVAQSLGRHPMRADVRTSLRPVLDPAGAVAGVHQRSAWSGDELDVEIEDTATFDTEAAEDRIEIESAGRTTKINSPATSPDRIVRGLLDLINIWPRMHAGLLTPIDLIPQKD